MKPFFLKLFIKKRIDKILKKDEVINEFFWQSQDLKLTSEDYKYIFKLLPQTIDNLEDNLKEDKIVWLVASIWSYKEKLKIDDDLVKVFFENMLLKTDQSDLFLEAILSQMSFSNLKNEKSDKSLNYVVSQIKTIKPVVFLHLVSVAENLKIDFKEIARIYKNMDQSFEKIVQENKESVRHYTYSKITSQEIFSDWEKIEIFLNKEMLNSSINLNSEEKSKKTFKI